MRTRSAVTRVGTSAARIPFSASLDVTPMIANVNTPRLLSITAFFPVGCGPAQATAATIAAEGVRILEVRLDIPSPDFAFSDLALVPYTLELNYSPQEVGDLPVRLVTSDGVAVGEAVVLTRSAKGDNTQFHMTVNWIDPASTETELALVPDAPRTAAVMGTWNFHDHQGINRRYAIDGVKWREPEVEAEGAIYDTTPNAARTTSPDSQDMPPAPGAQLGLVRITFHGLNSARIFALGFGGNVLFTSNLVRTVT
ncbi:MAG: hypothetical protein LH481_07030 [Burkholderiales bacterium]|nr:hypothetical protein [Burkholderiales bacterium]